MQKRIGLYGGTFDPVHTGHISLVHSFLESGFIDEIWVILTPFPPHKQDQNPTNYSHRFNMLHYAFELIEKVDILTIESELPKPSYTYRTIEYLKSEFPSHTFYYCLGGDSLVNFHTWKHPELILKHTELLVAGRRGEKYEDIDKSILEKSHFVEHELIDVSSTEIKSRISGNKSLEGLVDQKVESYIRTHQLYLPN